MLVDASLLVAILCDEPDGEEQSRRLRSARAPIISPVAVFETVAAIRREFRISVGSALHALTLFLKRANITVVPLDAEAHLLALAAFERFGKGMGEKPS